MDELKRVLAKRASEQLKNKQRTRTPDVKLYPVKARVAPSNNVSETFFKDALEYRKSRMQYEDDDNTPTSPQGLAILVPSLGTPAMQLAPTLLDLSPKQIDRLFAGKYPGKPVRQEEVENENGSKNSIDF